MLHTSVDRQQRRCVPHATQHFTARPHATLIFFPERSQLGCRDRPRRSRWARPGWSEGCAGRQAPTAWRSHGRIAPPAPEEAGWLEDRDPRPGLAGAQRNRERAACVACVTRSVSGAGRTVGAVRPGAVRQLAGMAARARHALGLARARHRAGLLAWGEALVFPPRTDSLAGSGPAVELTH
jgi:hypothetical protein